MSTITLLKDSEINGIVGGAKAAVSVQAPAREPIGRGRGKGGFFGLLMRILHSPHWRNGGGVVRREAYVTDRAVMEK